MGGRVATYEDAVTTLIWFFGQNNERRAKALAMHREIAGGACAYCRVHEDPEKRRHENCLVAYTAGVAERIRQSRSEPTDVILGRPPGEDPPSWTNLPNAGAAG